MSEMIERTPWFKANKVSPPRDGWYEVKCEEGWVDGRRYWNGMEWLRQGVYGFGFGCDSWRGLTKKAVT